MALVLKDRVKETSTTTGTGTFTLAGAVSGFQSFSVIGNANTVYYAIVNLSAPEWEVGLGTYTSSGTLLSRDTVLESSNSGSKVNFSAGTKDVFCTYPAEKAVTADTSGNVGVGTSSPKTRLQSTAGTNLNAPSLGSATNAPFYLTNTDANYGLLAGVSAGDGHAWLQPQRTDGTATAYNLTLCEAGGNLLVGGTTVLNGSRQTTYSSTGVVLAGRNTSAAAGKFWNIPYIDANNQLYIINQNNTGVYIGEGQTSWTANSDERLKDIIEPIENATAKVSSLRAVIGKYKTDEEGTRRSFLIAQDVQAVLPEAVSVGMDDMLGVQYTEVIPLLVAAIKEQQALITQLQAQLTAVSADVAALKGN